MSTTRPLNIPSPSFTPNTVLNRSLLITDPLHLPMLLGK